MDEPSDKSTTSGSDPKPQRWWQWVLLYPALLLAAISAVPDWVDRALAVYYETSGNSFAEAEEQNTLWRRNLTCSAAPFAWYSNPENVKIDATICNSGDVFVRASTPKNEQFFKWIPVSEVIREEKGRNPIIPPANAQVYPRSAGDQLKYSVSNYSPTPVQYQNARVVCQRFLDQRRLVRHVQTPQGCFDEIIDTFNGAIINRQPTPCRNRC